MTIIPAFGNNLQQHYGLIKNPLLTDNYEITNDPSLVFPYAKGIEIEGSLYTPPKQVYYLSYVKTWEITVNLDYGGTIVSETVSVASSPVGALGDVPYEPTFSYLKNASGAGGSVSIYVFGRDFPTWEWTRGIWVPDLVVNIVCFNGPDSLGEFGIGKNETPIGGANGDITINFCGNRSRPYDFLPGGSQSSPTGFIAIHPLDWIDWS